jgi:prolipoprotein diacylglyceryltransferase
VPTLVIALDYDPVLRLGDFLVRWQTIAVAVVIAASLVLAALLGRRSTLRADDLLYLAIGIVPGAVIGGRIGYALAHADQFTANPPLLVDPATGGLELAGAVVGGTLTGAYVARLLGAPVGRWAHVAAFALLFGLGAGKLAMVLGGSGQGLPSDASWATAYLGPGPWGSLAPQLPSNPSQAYEGVASLGLLLVIVVVVGLVGAFRSRDGRLLIVAIGVWALLRAMVSSTWRDPTVAGALPAGGVLALGVAVGCAVVLVVATIVAYRRGVAPGVASKEPAWPDPATRPPF